jgi:hypothetical protein
MYRRYILRRTRIISADVEEIHTQTHYIRRCTGDTYSDTHALYPQMYRRYILRRTRIISADVQEIHTQKHTHYIRRCTGDTCSDTHTLCPQMYRRYILRHTRIMSADVQEIHTQTHTHYVRRCTGHTYSDAHALYPQMYRRYNRLTGEQNPCSWWQLQRVKRKRTETYSKTHNLVQKILNTNCSINTCNLHRILWLMEQYICVFLSKLILKFD